MANNNFPSTSIGSQVNGSSQIDPDPDRKRNWFCLGGLLLMIFVCLIIVFIIVAGIVLYSTNPSWLPSVQLPFQRFTRTPYADIQQPTPPPTPFYIFPTQTTYFIPTTLVYPTVTPDVYPTYPPPITLTNSPPTYYPLSNCAASRIHKGDSVYVDFTGGNNAIRSSADVHSSTNKISVAYSGDVLVVIGDPVCSYGWILWEVRTVTGLTGWTPESDGNTFWLDPIISWQACSNAPLSRLHVNDTAFVGFDPDLPLNVRTGAGTNYPIFRKFLPGEKVNILSGPSCADGMVWWKISSQQNSDSGWSAEGMGSDYYLIPIIKP
jgi:hypothetical protein